MNMIQTEPAELYHQPLRRFCRARQVKLLLVGGELAWA
jgi:hypothetical protein